MGEPCGGVSLLLVEGHGPEHGPPDRSLPARRHLWHLQLVPPPPWPGWLAFLVFLHAAPQAGTSSAEPPHRRPRGWATLSLQSPASLVRSWLRTTSSGNLPCFPLGGCPGCPPHTLSLLLGTTCHTHSVYLLPTEGPDCHRDPRSTCGWTPGSAITPASCSYGTTVHTRKRVCCGCWRGKGHGTPMF